MKRFFYIIVITIMVFCSCSNENKTEPASPVDTIPMIVMQIQKCSRLHTAECKIHKIITHKWLGFPLFYGISRKGFIGRMYGIPCPADRDEATAQLQLELCRAGVEALRVHNVAVTLRVILAAGF